MLHPHKALPHTAALSEILHLNFMDCILPCGCFHIRPWLLTFQILAVVGTRIKRKIPVHQALTATDILVPN